MNQGIRNTIAREPERFLAYNNGITLTAESVGLCVDRGGTAITNLEGLQIVNGGQTTASLLATARGRADLSQVNVAAKLIEIESGDSHDELVRSVSRYANSQNGYPRRTSRPMTPSTWGSRNSPEPRGHRPLWEPSGRRDGSTNVRAVSIRWRGGGGGHAGKTQDIPGRASHRAAFLKDRHRQFESTWDQRPDVVSRGAQKNFSDFMIRLEERERVGAGPCLL